MSESHLDASIVNFLLHINDYMIYRFDRNIHEDGIAFYVKDQITIKTRQDFGCIGVEALWLQMQLPYFNQCFYNAVISHQIPQWHV